MDYLLPLGLALPESAGSQAFQSTRKRFCENGAQVLPQRAEDSELYKKVNCCRGRRLLLAYENQTKISAPCMSKMILLPVMQSKEQQQ